LGRRRGLGRVSGGGLIFGESLVKTFGLNKVSDGWGGRLLKLFFPRHTRRGNITTDEQM
jgi:hypothetical protein